MTNRELCKEFQQKWSLGRVQNMSLEEYTGVGGAERDDFCYWIESRLDKIGSIWGGSAFKFGIYKCKKDEAQRVDGNRVYADGYAWLKKYGDTKEKAFNEIKSRILAIIRASLANDLTTVNSVDFGISIKWKIAFHYQNLDDMKIIDIFRNEWLKRIAEQELGNKNLAISQVHTKLLTGKTWNLEDIQKRAQELWRIYSDLDRQYWLYKPGEQGNKWEEMYDEGLMGIGWRKLGDLTKYKNANEIESKLNEFYPTSSENRMNDKATNWDFCNTIKEGDIVIVASGRYKLLGYGEVVSEYFYDESIDDEFASFREIDWSGNERSWKVSNNDPLPIKTLTNITKLKTREGKSFPQKLLSIMDGENISGSLDTILDSAESTRVNIPLNQILFGPPGTGKTYDTINKSLEILQSYKQIEAMPESRETQKELFDDFKQKGQIAFVTFHQSYGYEEFVEGIKPDVKSSEVRYEIKSGIFKTLCKSALENPQIPYILIIDEINRGNIAKILGELITLLESSKRIGEPEELRVNLPYSGDEFGVPKNLYIIGTMNTADRSIALLDTALRRRFEFIEMMPDSKHLSEDCDGINLKELLDSMNKRITFLLDREHQIGHSFLLDVKNINDLRAIFAKKIIPLLQEYFYDDYAKINAVLNDNGMIKARTQKDLGINLKDDFVDSEKVVYEITESSNWQEWQFQKICENNEKPKNTDSTESSPAESADEPNIE